MQMSCVITVAHTNNPEGKGYVETYTHTIHPDGFDEYCKAYMQIMQGYIARNQAILHVTITMIPQYSTPDTN